MSPASRQARYQAKAPRFRKTARMTSERRLDLARIGRALQPKEHEGIDGNDRPIGERIAQVPQRNAIVERHEQRESGSSTALNTTKTLTWKPHQRGAKENRSVSTMRNRRRGRRSSSSLAVLQLPFHVLFAALCALERDARTLAACDFLRELANDFASAARQRNLQALQRDAALTLNGDHRGRLLSGGRLRLRRRFDFRLGRRRRGRRGRCCWGRRCGRRRCCGWCGSVACATSNAGCRQCGK